MKTSLPVCSKRTLIFEIAPNRIATKYKGGPEKTHTRPLSESEMIVVPLPFGIKKHGTNRITLAGKAPIKDAVQECDATMFNRSSTARTTKRTP